MTLLLAGLVAIAIAIPHALTLERVSPLAASAIWLCALVLRALAAIFLVIVVVVEVPETQLFAALTQWCWHTVLPLFAAHLGLSGHQLGDAAMIAPAFALAASALSAAWALDRARRAVRRMLQTRALGRGPHGSVIVGGGDVLVAAAGIRRPRIVVSAGALVRLDDEELAAGVAHEHGHIARSHRFVLIVGQLCCAAARFLPGARRALVELAFELERDADEYALAAHHDRHALASAICKSATSAACVPALMALGGSGKTVARVRLLLLQGDGRAPRGLHSRLAGGLAIAMAALTLIAAVSLPVATAASISSLSSQTAHVARCLG